MATSFKRSQKGQIRNQRSNTYHGKNLLKIGQGDPEILFLKGFIF